MSNLVVETVVSRGQQRQFFDFPWRLYRHDPHWVPPLRRNQLELLGFRRHPFYDRAASQAFLARRGERTVARVLAIDNPTHNERYGERRGFFGFFEAEDDPEAARAVLAAAWQWLQGRGMTSLRGPINPSLNYEVGLLVDGFHEPPTFMMTYNPPYYAELLEGFGLVKTQDLYAFGGHVEMIAGLDKKLEFIVAECTRRFELKLRRLDHRRFDAEVRMFLDIYNQSLGGTWGFTPLSPSEVRHASKALKHLIVPEMTSVAEVDGRPIGVVFGLLDYNPRIKAIDGRLFPFGFWRLLTNRKALRRVRLISSNVLPEYQKWGVGLVLAARLVPDILAWGIQEVEFSWVLESNHLSRKTLERGGAKLMKTYRLYDYEP